MQRLAVLLGRQVAGKASLVMLSFGLGLVGLVGLGAAGCGDTGRVLYLANTGCQSDLECKDNRVCFQGACRFPGEQLDGGGVVPDGGPRPDAGPDAGPDGGPDGGPDAGADAGADGGPVILDGGLADGGVGAPCAGDIDCVEGQSPQCFSEGTTNGTFPGGYCSASCSDAVACPAGSSCGMFFNGGGACVRDCDVADPSSCRQGYVCSSLLGPLGCIPQQLAP